MKYLPVEISQKVKELRIINVGPTDRKKEEGQWLSNVHGLSLSKVGEVALCSLFSSLSLVTLTVCADLLTYKGGDVAHTA